MREFVNKKYVSDCQDISVMQAQIREPLSTGHMGLTDLLYNFGLHAIIKEEEVSITCTASSRR